MANNGILDWLDSNYKEKVNELRNQQKEILEEKENLFKEELLTKAHDYRDVKFSNITNENRIDINNLLQKFRYNKDLLIAKKISEIVENTLESLRELIESHESFSRLYYSNLVKNLASNFPEIKKIHYPCKIEALIPSLKQNNHQMEFICSKNIEIGIIGELEDASFIHYSPMIMYDNNKDEIRKAIFKLLSESE